MHTIHELLHQYGESATYFITFLWTALEGETFVIFAGLAAQKGLLNVWGIFVAAWLGSMFGDQVFFILGRYFGVRTLERMPRLKPGVERAISWLERYAIAYILLYRFMYGLRNVSGVAVGLSHIPWKKFAFWNAVAAFLWASVFVGFGYSSGEMITHFGRHREEAVNYGVREIMIGVLCIFALIILVKLVIFRIKKTKLEKQTLENTPKYRRND